MSDQTVNLALPYILPSQAQKHVTHNQALQRLDATIQLAITAEQPTPPDTPDEGACYLVGPSATGAWAGKSGQLAFRQDGAWIYLLPHPGWRAWFLADDRLRVLRSGAWNELDLPENGELSTLGINAGADSTNRLTVSAPATLFNNAGNGHQIKVNKAATGDTASLLFQTGWSGRAEMGLAGNDAFSVKVSPDGSSWQTGLSVSPAGIVDMPCQPLVRASLSSGAVTPADGSDTGFDHLSIVRGGFALGSSLGTTGNTLVVPTDGLYLLVLNCSILTSSGHTARLLANGTTTLATVAAAAASTVAFRQSTTGLAQLHSGDVLTLHHSGTAQYDFGDGKTEIIALRL